MEFMEFIDIFTFYNSYLNLIPLELNFIILNYLDEVSDIDNAILHMNFTTENFKELIRNTFFDIDINKVIHINWNSDNPIYFQTIFLKLIGQYKKAKKA